MENRTIYDLMTDPAFIKFNDWLQAIDIDFQKLSDTELMIKISEYTNSIQYRLIDWFEAYQSAD